MRPPPPLTLLGAPSRAWLAACAALGAAAAAALAAWAVGHLEVPPWWAAATMLAAAAAGLALGARAAGPRQPVLVCWDGVQWWVDGVPGQLQVMLGLERWLLMRQRPIGGGRARWLALSGAQVSGDWRALRTALYCGPLPAPQADPSAWAGSAATTTAAPPTRAPERAAD